MLFVMRPAVQVSFQQFAAVARDSSALARRAQPKPPERGDRDNEAGEPDAHRIDPKPDVRRSASWQRATNFPERRENFWNGRS
jgi:hypothetical protein